MLPERMSMRPIIIVPSALSALRLVLGVWLPFMPEQWRLPAVLAGGLSDWADGVIARRWRATTAAGAMLDAAADKLFTLSVLITLTTGGMVQPWQVALVLCRDVTVAAIAAYALLIGRLDSFKHMRPRLAGKLTTSIVFVWFIAILAGAAAALDNVLFALAAAVSAVAGADYLWRFMHRSAEWRGRKPSPAATAP